MTPTIITLLSDWDFSKSYSAELSDDVIEINPIGGHYVAQLKGLLFQLVPNAIIIDITHNIQPHNTTQAAYILKTVYPHYPENTIHIVGVNSEPSKKNKIILVKHNEQYFIGANDGLFSMVLDKEPSLVIELPVFDDIQGFKALTTLAITVKSIIEKNNLSNLGSAVKMQKDIPTNAVYDNDSITGTVIFIDSFGNLITNISHDLFYEVGKGRSFKIRAQNYKNLIYRISDSYDEVAEQEGLALFNSSYNLELAIRNGNMARLYHMDTKSIIRITFDESKLF